ncbi:MULTISPECIES: protein kinase domain-containing protein [unclassified Sphingomonas]|jgi:serine/threonine protein kinase|uniref:protein kinase domain-containing protein n=1 Tax=unclassified Sphingomonas TaxID=196159 RepID=UPI0009E9B7B1|nr:MULTISPECIES: protein kinase [unclassified Sphingomonas]
MDRAKATGIFRELHGQEISGWSITKLLDNGKSAAVFRGEKEGAEAAIKIFDTDLINRFGDDALMARSEREKKLINHDHPHLVRMLDAGVDEKFGYHFLAMEFVQGKSLADCLEYVPENNIALLIEQLASAAQFLEGLELAHRDIKPANIMISPDFQRLTLLDLGVLKPFGESGLTDHGSQTLFIGTNQYASPEFALRKEVDDQDGWRALSFYQIGAVLHDLIMKRPIFEQHLGVPARLAHAVQSEVVQIRSATVAPWLVTLAQNCLVKSPETRLRLVRWESFAARAPKTDMALELRERIRQRVAAATTIQEETKRYQSPMGDADDPLGRMTANLLQDLMRTIGRTDLQLGRRIVYEVPDHRAIRCDFEPSERAGIPNGLTVCFRFEVSDPASRVVRLTGCHAASAGRDWQPGGWDTVFEGPFDETGIEDAVGIFVLTGMDEAQVAALERRAE